MAADRSAKRPERRLEKGPDKGMRARRVEEGVRVEVASLIADEVKDPEGGRRDRDARRNGRGPSHRARARAPSRGGR